MPKPKLLVAVGDIHGRFGRVEQWLETLEQARGRPIDAVFAVGDVEAFADPGHQFRKVTKRELPAEFLAYARGDRRWRWHTYFIGGNNEDFERLHEIPDGATLAPNLTYLGRHGVGTVDGLRVAFLSGIFAPRYFDKPLLAPRTRDTVKQAGYFRVNEVRALSAVSGTIDIMLTHEWPRGIVRRASAEARGVRRPLRAYRFPWIGNAHTRELVETLRPRWLFCGHSHVAYATSLLHARGAVTRIACLDQTARAEGAVLWLEWQGRSAVAAGWGLSGEACWHQGERWDESRTPTVGDETAESAAG